VTNERTGSTVDGEGRGLLNMWERAKAVGGVLVAGPYERQWRVRAELPAEGEVSWTSGCPAPTASRRRGR
jgi:hypothetical protein